MYIDWVSGEYWGLQNIFAKPYCYCISETMLLLYLLAEESVFCAVPKERSMGKNRNSHLYIPFGVLPAQHYTVVSQQGYECDVVLSGHIMFS